MCRQGKFYWAVFFLAIFSYISPPFLLESNYAIADGGVANSSSLMASPTVPLSNAGVSSELGKRALENKKSDELIVTYITLGLLVVIIGGMFGNMWALQRRYFIGCKEERKADDTIFTKPRWVTKRYYSFDDCILGCHFVPFFYCVASFRARA